MRTCFITTEEINEYRSAHKCGVFAALEAICPFTAEKFSRRCGGYKAFESWADYELECKQK